MTDRERLRPWLTVDLVILTVRESLLQVLIIERANEPYRGRAALPGGFVRVGEVLREAAERELAEETGLDGEYDFTMDLTPDESSPSPLDPAHLINAMREQLGLSLKSQDALVDFFVIDRAERVVAGN